MVDLRKMKKGAASPPSESKAKIDHRSIVGYEGETATDVGCIAYESIKVVTGKAALIVRPGGEELWVPKSVIVDSDDDNITVASWWVRKNRIDTDW